MKSAEDNGFCDFGTEGDNVNGSSCNFEFDKGTSTSKGMNPRAVLSPLSKPGPSKWDDAEKWLIGLSNGLDQGHSKTNKPRNSNADDRKHLLQKTRSTGEGSSNCGPVVISNADEGETRKIDCEESFWMINKSTEDSSIIRSICVRDMGTEMSPIGSEEPSRTGTPLRTSTLSMRSPDRTRVPSRRNQAVQSIESDQVGWRIAENRSDMVPHGRSSFSGTCRVSKDGEDSDASKILHENNLEQNRRSSMVETRAFAWDEAERAKYMARYKREEVKIQAWEDSQKRRAEAEMKTTEVKAERMKARAQERLANRLAITQRKADVKRANAEAKMKEHAVRTSERADYIRRTGHLPTCFFSFNLPSFCW
ncbi:Uncharacterized protein EJ110_NYTH42605 [Nymphaea thermarum]|nr:Uncharacterized protein EJ110_NYTH42605 [Nymphaea thermarum]